MRPNIKKFDRVISKASINWDWNILMEAIIIKGDLNFFSAVRMLIPENCNWDWDKLDNATKISCDATMAQSIVASLIPLPF